jgi:protein-S-isoprenylcysteine O-methyltransferase Ste14
MKKYFDLLIRFHKQKSTSTRKVISLTVGAIFFIVVLPYIFFWIASFMNSYFSFDISNVYKIPIEIVSILIGLLFLIWATYSQLKIGGGTPAPNAPTQKLVVLGPYKYCRNPIEFGALFYYFGVGMLFGTLFHGIVCMSLGFIIGSSYHKFTEEKELLLRFGDEYAKYRDSTPFLIPRFW